jgi:ribosome biogenesis protein MAK21
MKTIFSASTVLWLTVHLT